MIGVKEIIWCAFRLLRAKKKLRRILYLILVCALLWFTVQSVHADGDETLDLQERVDEIVTGINSRWPTLFNNAKTKDGETKFIIPKNVTAGNAGAVLGYGTDEAGLVQSFLGGAVSFDSTNMSYRSLRSIQGAENKKSESTNEEGLPLYYYGMYGYTLHHIGLVSTSVSSLGFIRPIAGAILLFGYYLAALVPTIFGLTISLLKIINPFRLLAIPLSGVVDIPASLQPAADFAGGIYSRIQNLAIVAVIPFFIATTVASILLFRKAGTMSRIWRLFLRMIIIVAAVPIVGSTYTAALDSIGEKVEAGNTAANRIVMSTFADTEAWAINQRMSPPMDGDDAMITMSGTPGSDYAYTGDDPKDVALTINSWNHSSAKEFVQDEPTLWDSLNILDKTKSKAFSQGKSILERYMNKDTFSASDYAGVVQGHIGATGLDEASANMFSMKANDFSNFEPFVISNNVTIYNNGGLSYDSSSDGGSVSFTELYTTGVNTSEPLYYNESGGLSTIAMYNFLNSSFTSSGVDMYYPARSTSKYTVLNIMSVSVVGTGSVMTFLNLAQAITEMYALGVLGILFGFATLGGGFKGFFAVLGSVPATLVGSLKGVARLITNTFLLITEVLATICLYLFIADILSVFSSLLRSLVSNEALVTLGVGTAGFVALIGPVVIPIIIIVVFVLFIIFALKYRKRLIKALDEAMASITDRFIDGTNNLGLDSGPSIRDGSNHPPARNTGSVLAGAGGALMMGDRVSHMMNNNKADGDKTRVDASTGDTKQEHNATNANTSTDADTNTRENQKNPIIKNEHAVQQQAEDIEKHGIVPKEKEASKTKDGVSIASDAATSDNKGVKEGSSIAGDAAASDSKSIAKDISIKDDSSITNDVTASNDEGISEAGSKAVKEKKIEENAADIKKQGKTKAITGAAETAAGYVTGDAKLMADGAQDGVKGLRQATDTKSAKAQARKDEVAKKVKNKATGSISSEVRGSGIDRSSGASSVEARGTSQAKGIPQPKRTSKNMNRPLPGKKYVENKPESEGARTSFGEIDHSVSGVPKRSLQGGSKPLSKDKDKNN